MSYTTVFNVKIDLTCDAVDPEDAADINESRLKDLLANVMTSPYVDGINILGGHTKKTKPIKNEL